MRVSRRVMLVSTLGLGLRPFGRGVNDARSVQGMFAESEAYERFMGRWSRRLAPLFVRFAEVGPGQDVLDVGSGTGVLASAVAEAVPSARIVGIDPSAAYVEYAEAHADGRPGPLRRWRRTGSSTRLHARSTARWHCW